MDLLKVGEGEYRRGKVRIFKVSYVIQGTELCTDTPLTSNSLRETLGLDLEGGDSKVTQLVIQEVR